MAPEASILLSKATLIRGPRHPAIAEPIEAGATGAELEEMALSRMRPDLVVAFTALSWALAPA